MNPVEGEAEKHDDNGLPHGRGRRDVEYLTEPPALYILELSSGSLLTQYTH
jgi:hypothetical protein